MSEAGATGTVEHAQAKHTHIGGQAVLEGVMMRGKYNWAVAVRAADGTIHTEEHDLVSGSSRHKWMKWPLIRGVVALVESLMLGMKAFTISASLAGETEEEQLSSKEVTMSLIMGVGLAILLFVVAPAFLTDWGLRPLFGAKPSLSHPVAWNLTNGLIRVIAFFLYIWAVSSMKDIQRVFAYHGAEHKVIHAYEHGLPLEAPIIQKWSTQHVRCGTSFLLMVMIIAILVFSLVPVKAMVVGWGIQSPLLIRLLIILSHLALFPVVAGLSYEITVKWAGNHENNPLVKVMLWPGLQMQRMTTRQPDDSMVEVAVAAVMPVIEREQREDAKGLAPAEASVSVPGGNELT